MSTKIGIIGGGFVGSATYLLHSDTLDSNSNKCIIYDLDSSKCIPHNTTFEDLRNVDIIFICLPTPMRQDGSCHTAIVEKVIQKIKTDFNFDLSSPSENQPHLVVRSTVPVGFCEIMGVHFMPEFLTEKNWKQDFYNCDNWIVGLNRCIPGWQRCQQLMTTIFTNAFECGNIKNNLVTFIKPDEAEMVKYMRNCFLATKVSFANEMYRFCEKMNINYNIVKNAVIYDKRVGDSHLMVPGHDGRFGYGGTCFGKDSNSMKFQLESKGVECPILNAVIYRNETIDRPEKDWMEDEGRAFVKN